jgi:hypothetical protein
MSAGIVALAYDRFHSACCSATLALAPLIGFAFEWGRSAAPGAERCGIRSPARRSWCSPLCSGAPALRSALEPTGDAAAGNARRGTHRRNAFPPDALFIAEQPTILASGGLAPVMRTRARSTVLTSSSKRSGAVDRSIPARHVLRAGFEGAGKATSCDALLQRFAASPVVEETLNVRRWTLPTAAAPGRVTQPAPAAAQGLTGGRALVIAYGK